MKKNENDVNKGNEIMKDKSFKRMNSGDMIGHR